VIILYTATTFTFSTSISSFRIEALGVQEGISTLTAKLRICFGHMKKFKAFPGPVVFLMALDICHVSVAQDIEGAKTSLYLLSLLSYHGENVTDCV